MCLVPLAHVLWIIGMRSSWNLVQVLTAKNTWFTVTSPDFWKINNFFNFHHHPAVPGLHKQTTHNNIQFDRIIFSLQRKLQLFIMALECREHVSLTTVELERSNSTTLFFLMKNPLDRSHLRNVNQPKAKSNDAVVVLIYVSWIICWCAISHQKESQRN